MNDFTTIFKRITAAETASHVKFWRYHLDFWQSPDRVILSDTDAATIKSAIAMCQRELRWLGVQP